MSNIFVQATGQYLRSVNTGYYVDGAGKILPGYVKNPDVSTLKTVEERWWKWDDTMKAVVEKSDAEKLPIIQGEKIAAINAKTADLTEVGFVYAGKTFALGEDAQGTIGEMADAYLLGILPLPINYGTFDDKEEITLSTPMDLLAFFTTIAVRVKGFKEAGRTLKAAVSGAKTVAEVDAVVDTRS